MATIKPIFYDDFYCIADQCPYDCCRDWGIYFDQATNQAYSNTEISNSYKYNPKKAKYQFNLKPDGTCVNLDENGLCKLVAKYGPDILCHTCATFPRFIIDNADLVQYGLSNSCPKVLSLLKQAPPPLAFVAEGDFPDNLPLHCQCRDYAIDILQIDMFPLWMRLVLLHRYGDQLFDASSAETILTKYQSADYLLQIFGAISTVGPCYSTTVSYSKMLMNWFISVYHKINTYKGYKDYVLPFENTFNIFFDNISDDQYNIFREYFSTHDSFIENMLVNCIYNMNRNIQKAKDLSVNLDMTILEYLFIQILSFLNWCNNDYSLTEIDFTNICTFVARIVENSNDISMINYLKESNLFEVCNLVPLICK